MTGVEQLVAISGVIFFAVTVKATFGFGEALIAMPLLSWILPIEQAGPVVALVSLVSGTSMLIRERRHIHFRGALQMIVPALISIPLGVWLLRTADDRIVKMILAIMILGFAFWSLKRTHPQELSHDRWAPSLVSLRGYWGVLTTRLAHPSSSMDQCDTGPRKSSADNCKVFLASVRRGLS